MRHFWSTIFTLGLAGFSTPSAGQTNAIIDLMDQAVSSAPAIQIAEADIVRARSSAKRIVLSPYEYQASASAGQRFIDDPLASETDFTEFGAGISKTIRLPDKKRLDQQLSDIEIEIAILSVEAAKFEEKLTFVKLWNDWAQAHRLVAVSKDQARDAAELVALESVKVEKGAARQINADILLAQSQMAEVMMHRDFVAANRAKLALQTRYPMIVLPDEPFNLSTPSMVMPAMDLQGGPSYPAQRLAALQSQKLRMKARRERLNKRPDPTLGMAVSNEFGGRETSVMGTISIPLGGKLRRATADEAQAQALKSEVESRLSYQLAAQDYAYAMENAKSYQTLIASSDMARKASRAAVGQIEKGYALGAITAQEVIVARKSLREAERTYAEYVGEAEAANLLLHLYTTAK